MTGKHDEWKEKWKKDASLEEILFGITRLMILRDSFLLSFQNQIII